MPSLRDIKKRIRSVTGSQKITRAMKLVAASKLRRAQAAALQARPYADEVRAMIGRVAGSNTGDDEVLHALCEQRPVKQTLLIVITSDRGSCGAFNSNIVRRAERFMREHQPRTGGFVLMTLGRKGNDAFGKRPGIAVRHVPDMVAAPRFSRIEQLAQEVIQLFLTKKVDEAFVLYNEAQGALAQVIRLRDVLPVSPEAQPLQATKVPAPTSEGSEAAGDEYLFEPSRAQLLQTLLPLVVAVSLQRALLESSAAEHGARMAAMDAATKNAGQMVEALTLQYNRARQAAITLELMDIVGGAEALAG